MAGVQGSVLPEQSHFHLDTDGIAVFVKHQGKRYEVELDPTSTGETFKFQLYSLTGVEPDRQKILVKGGQLKDDTDLSTLGASRANVHDDGYSLEWDSRSGATERADEIYGRYDGS